MRQEARSDPFNNPLPNQRYSKAYQAKTLNMVSHWPPGAREEGKGKGRGPRLVRSGSAHDRWGLAGRLDGISGPQRFTTSVRINPPPKELWYAHVLRDVAMDRRQDRPGR